MKEIWKFIQVLLSAIGGTLIFLLGGIDGILHALILFVVFDYITGVLRAINEKKLSSSVGFKGISKKILIFILVGVAQALDVHVLGEIGAIRSIVIIFYLSNEGISILENASCIGVPIPSKLKEVLEQLHEKEKEDK